MPKISVNVVHLHTFCTNPSRWRFHRSYFCLIAYTGVSDDSCIDESGRSKPDACGTWIRRYYAHKSRRNQGIYLPYSSFIKIQV